MNPEDGAARPPGGSGRAGGPRVSPAARRRRKRRLKPALLTGTSGEYLGRKPLPRVLRERLLIVVCGPRCVGKSSVALALAGDKVRVLDGRSLSQAAVWRVRQKRWSKALIEVPSLVLDGPVFLCNRPSAAAMVGELLRERCAAGLRTVLVEGPVGDGSVELLMDAVAPELRATLTLRFPLEGGRMRFALGVCEDLGLPRELARATLEVDPWCYRAVRQRLEGQVQAEEEPSAASGGA